MKKLILIFLLIPVLATFANAAELKGEMVDFSDDIAYHEIFPIKVAGKKMKASGHTTYDSVDSHDDVICSCKRGQYEVYGLTTSFWEPARMIETVKTPYYFPFLGETMGDVEESGFKKGTNSQAGDVQPHTFRQAHYVIFPVWAILGLIQDMLCSENDTIGLDIGYMTELDPLWQSDSLTAQIQPEATLFASQYVQLACIADAVSSNTIMPLDMLFWCLGSTGSAYPLTGNFANPNPVEANNGIATRLLFKLGREGLLPDKEVNLCYSMPQPILRKSIAKLQLVRPVANQRAHPPGRTSMMYGTNKNPAFGTSGNPPDEFLWLHFNKAACCML